MIIGITGRAGEGKTSIAKHINARYGYEVVAFAAPLKKAVATLFDIPIHYLNDPILKIERISRWGKSSREIMQTFGEGMRTLYGQDFWVKLMEDNIRNMADVVIEDVRYPEEASMIQRHGGFLIRVLRPNNPYRISQKHSSEQVDRLVWTEIIANNGTLNQLDLKVDELMERLK